MRKKAMIRMYATGLICLFASSCGQPDHASGLPQDNIDMAKQVKITALPALLNKMENGDMDADFFGITSNGTDCIYFVQENKVYTIEFEVMTEAQKPWMDTLKRFAEQHHYKTWMTTYGNPPAYNASGPAPVLRIITASNVGETASIAQHIMMEVFGNNEETLYDIVP